MSKLQQLFLIYATMAVFVFFTPTKTSFAQSNSASMSESLMFEAKLKAEKFKQRLEADNQLTAEETKYAVDTFYFNAIYQIKNTTNSCPECIYEHMCELYNKYDSMSATYENLILAKLNPNDQVVLRATIKNWNTFKESEKKLQALIFKDEYHNNSSVQRYLSALGYLHTSKFRLSELANTYFNLISN
jgi:hypothetical protein